MSKLPPKSGHAKPTAPMGATPLEIVISSSLLEIIPDAIVAVNSQGEIVQVNTQTEALFGYARNELVGQKVELLVPEADRHSHRQHREDFAQAPRVRRMGPDMELSGRRKNGTEFPVEISLSPVVTEQGTVVLSAIREISDRRRIEQELRRAHEELSQRTDRELWDYRSRLASIIDSSDDAIIGKDLDGIVTTWNRGAERIYGYTAEEMVGKSISTIAPNDRPDEILGILDNIRNGLSVEHYETSRITKDGRRLNISISVSPIRNSEGTIVGASAIARNITDQKRAEDQLRQAQKMEAVGRLAGGVAHDFNNVLGIIMACTEFLNTGPEGKTERKTKEYVDNIRTAAQRGAGLTRQLLAFSRKQAVQPTVFDLNDRLNEVAKLVRPLMGSDVDVVLKPRSSTSAAVIEADPGQIDQIVLNLAVNARDAMPLGGKLILETDVTEFDDHMVRQHPQLTPGKYVLLAVSDTGIGMDEATVSRIFEPFFTTKEVGKGTGLGLATVYGIVRQSGGYVWVYSEPGRGTTFKIYFPSAEHKLGLASSRESEVAFPRGDGTTILLVEDDDLMRSLTKQMLEEHGYSVLEAKDGASALDQVTRGDARIDCVLTDVVMRGLSGIELGSRLSQTHPETRVVYMSGYTGELITKSDTIQLDLPLLEKPFTRNSLLKALQGSRD
jgi:PAS domain S-box-containing protein